MFKDLRYSLRSIRHAPGFSLVVTLTLMLGVGAPTAIFSIVDAVLLRPLPYPAAESLVKVSPRERTSHAARHTRKPARRAAERLNDRGS